MERDEEKADPVEGEKPKVAAREPGAAEPIEESESGDENESVDDAADSPKTAGPVLAGPEPLEVANGAENKAGGGEAEEAGPAGGDMPRVWTISSRLSLLNPSD